MTPQDDHKKKINAIALQIKNYNKNPSSKKLRFFHGGTNSTREQNMEHYYAIDISGLGKVLTESPR